MPLAVKFCFNADHNTNVKNFCRLQYAARPETDTRSRKFEIGASLKKLAFLFDYLVARFEEREANIPMLLWIAFPTLLFDTAKSLHLL